ncbi:bifunctional 2-polyprenyl-6-hydroxyphenol methylase/3-demethylubiquinol 3-O-methyltransferase UbiG [Geminocystis sp. NIES-3708]|uniref:class I SAM-dependent methyltransferase n=1 Tax=Geminocystis sp. NIES-3708 TaxID=1615909 RepID=UPI0011873B85|nr:class I SAM-dependent methyltransferase [Geminocystis sp. NIES-3708]
MKTSSFLNKSKSFVKKLLANSPLNIMPSFRSSPTWVYGTEQPPEFYDEKFLEQDYLRKHYTQSGYYSLWSIIADRIRLKKINSLLDVGCGTGQMGLFLFDQGLPNYLGFDFSPKRVDYAKKLCPNLQFLVADAFETDLFDIYNYDAILCTEVLEHVDKDLEIIQKIRPETRFYGTVPNYPATGHVRHFKSVQEVLARYETYFYSLDVAEHLISLNGNKIYIMDGIKN